MSVQLQTWLEKLKREVTEGSAMARRVRLCTVGDGTVWQTWEPVSELDPVEWASEAEALISGLKSELPKRRIQLVLQAEDHGGATISNVIRSVTGENPQAQDLGTANGPKALADAMVSVQKLMDSTLETARKMMTFQSEQLERVSQTLHDYHELFMALKKVELESEETQSAASKIMVEQFQQAAPMLMQLAQHFIMNPKNTNGGTSAAVAAAATGVKAS